MKLNTGHPNSIDKFCYQLIISSLKKPIQKSVEVRIYVGGSMYLLAELLTAMGYNGERQD